MSDAREAFEKWAQGKSLLINIREEMMYAAGYINAKEMAWEAWQAALQSGEPEVDVTGMDEEDAMFTQIEAKARATYRRHSFSAKGQMITRADSYESHLVWAAIDWAKANTAPQPVVEGYVPMSDYKQLSDLCSRQGMRLMDYEADLEKMVDALEKAATHLREAAELVADWGAYAGDYFKNKHDLQADIKLCKDRADAIEALLSAGKENNK